jgi:hypothetical protein
MNHRRSAFAFTSVILAALGASACQGKVLDVGSAGASASAGTGTPPSLAGNGTAPAEDGIVAVLPGVGVSAMAADETNLYLGSEGNILALPKAGGAPITLVDGSKVGQNTEKISVVVDGDFVYFSNLDNARIGRVPKQGGDVHVVADGLLYPQQMAMDGTDVYVITEDTVAGTGNSILRFPKDGGAIETVATHQPTLTTLVLSDADVYFAAGYEATGTEIRHVAKTGGDVTTIASGIDSRGQVTTLRGGGVYQIVVAGDKLAFVEPFTGVLAFVPRAGGAVVRTSTAGVSAAGLAFDGTSLFGFTYSDVTGAAALDRFDVGGAVQGSLTSWTYANPRPMMPGGVDPAIATVLEKDRIYWADSDIDNDPTTTIRTVTLGAATSPTPAPATK